MAQVWLPVTDLLLRTQWICLHQGVTITDQGRIQEFWKGEPGKGAKPQTSAGGVLGPPAENFKKLDAISCNLAYIFGIRMASDIIQNWAFAEQITVAAKISKPTNI